MSELLIDEPLEGVRRITLNRPDRFNAFTFGMYSDFIAALESLRHDTRIRVVILTGAGRGFCSGHDMSGEAGTARWIEAELGAMQAKTALMSELARIPLLMRNLGQPIICAVNGAAAGIGLSLAVACDLCLASTSAKFVNAIHNAATGAELGLSWMLPRIVGTQRAAEILLTALPVSAAEAERIGLVLRAVPEEQLMPETLRLAEAIMCNVPLGVAMTKRSLWINQGVGSLEAAAEIEQRAVLVAQATEDAVEKRKALLDKRRPRFRNR